MTKFQKTFNSQIPLRSHGGIISRSIKILSLTLTIEGEDNFSSECHAERLLYIAVLNLLLILRTRPDFEPACYIGKKDILESENDFHYQHE